MNDLKLIIHHNLKLINENDKEQCTNMICQFIEYLRSMEIIKKLLITIRDLLSWIEFINLNSLNSWKYSYEQGAYLVFIDSIETNSKIKENICKFLFNQLENEIEIQSNFEINENEIQIGQYRLKRGEKQMNSINDYCFQAPTTRINLERLVRAMQLNKKPILIEGNPGVGKTSLVMALAKLAGYSFIRINLSEQTDISDLFGSDLPDIESGEIGKFRWHDGPLLKAIKTNQWIILDELNLANQSVLEGLNACLDHRGEIYIPELNRTFFIHQKNEFQPLRIFACQNPYGQTAGRKGLPKSFLNRFTTIYFSIFQRIDLKIICQELFSNFNEEILEKILNFHQMIEKEFSSNQWEFNLRDLLKWCQLINENNQNLFSAFHLIYFQRMRTKQDQEKILFCYTNATGWKIQSIENHFHFDSKILRVKKKKFFFSFSF